MTPQLTTLFILLAMYSFFIGISYKYDKHRRHSIICLVLAMLMTACFWLLGWFFIAILVQPLTLATLVWLQKQSGKSTTKGQDSLTEAKRSFAFVKAFMLYALIGVVDVLMGNAWSLEARGRLFLIVVCVLIGRIELSRDEDEYPALSAKAILTTIGIISMMWGIGRPFYEAIPVWLLMEAVIWWMNHRHTAFRGRV